MREPVVTARPAMFDLEGHTAFVAGGSRGIGWRIAAQFVEHGGRVTIASRNFQKCRERADELNESAGKEVAWPCAFDLADLASIDAAVAASAEHWSGLSTLFANSYFGASGYAHELDPELFAKSLRLNIVHNARLAVAAFPWLRASGRGSAVFVGSASGLAPSPSVVAYGIAKHGLHELGRDFAVEWGPHGVRSNVLVPGMTSTDAVERSFSEERQRTLSQTWPLRRLGNADEIAAAAIFLASPGAGFTTGTVLVCDGGRTLIGGNTAMALHHGQTSDTP